MAERRIDAERLVDQLVDAVVVADETGTVILANQAAERLLGGRHPSLVGTPILTFIPERFRAAHLRGFERFLATRQGEFVGGSPLQVAALRADGAEVPIELTLGVIEHPDAGVAVVAAIRDVSRRVALEQQAVLSRYLQATVEATRDGVLAWSQTGQVLAVNRRFSEVWGIDPAQVAVGADAAQLSQHLARMADPQPLLDALAAARENPTRPQTFEVLLRDGRLVEGYGAPMTDVTGLMLGRVWYVHDETERRAAEENRAALMSQLAEAQRAQRFLLDASAVLAHATGFAQTVEALAQVAVPTLGDLCLIDVTDVTGRTRRMAAVHADPARQPLADELRARYAPAEGGAHPSVEAMRTVETRWSAEMSDEFLRSVTRDERHYQITKQLGCLSYMTVPLADGDDVFGTVTLLSAGSGRRFGEADVALAEELAERVALVVAKERRYDTQRVLSHTLQASLLPAELPVVDGVEFAVRYLPGTLDAELGGDFWDVALTPAGDVVAALGDVAGHDMTAAATMAQLRSACRALRSQSGSPEELVGLLHANWDQLGLERIATAVFLRLDAKTGRLRLASAGHLPPLLVEPERATFLQIEPAAPFGAPSAGAPALWDGELPSGATLVLYTDGLVEDRQHDIDDGLQQLARTAAAAPSREPEALVAHIVAALSGDDRADDVAVLAIHRP